MIREAIRSFWAEISTPSAFANDPYGALTNQAGHVACGASMVAVGAMVADDFWFFWLSFAGVWAAWMLGNIITTWRRLP